MKKIPVLSIVLISLSYLFISVSAQGKNHQILKCLVCEKIFEEMKRELEKPEIIKGKVSVGGYHLDDKGNSVQRVIPSHQSDVVLSEILDGVCEKMKDYVRARRKSDNKLIILPLVLPGGAMNPEFGETNPIFDSDLNKSLGYYCQEITNEYDEEIIETVKKNFSEGKEANDFCSSVAPYCVDIDTLEYVDGPALNTDNMMGNPDSMIGKDEF